MSALRAAAAEVDLEPGVGCYLTGFAGRPGPSTGQHDPVLARAVLLDDGSAQLLVIACDLLGLMIQTVAEIRLRIAARTDIPYGNILICCTHTHSGPAIAPCRGCLGYVDHHWLDEAKTRIVELVDPLPAALRPATLGHASTIVPGIGHNRQDSSHPFDEELTVIAIDAEDAGAIATLVNYGTHAIVLGGHNLQVSADYPGAVTAQLEDRRGGVGLFLQGSCGDVNPARYLEPKAITFDDLDEIGRCLVDAALAALNDAERTRDVRLAVGRRIIDVPVDPLPPAKQVFEQVAEVEARRREAVTGGGAPDAGADCLEQLCADRIVAIETGAGSEAIRVEMFAAAINDLRIVAAPFEAYSEVGLGIKKGLAPLKGIFVGYANGLFGYLSSDLAKEQGGYGPEGSNQWFSTLLTAMGYGAAARLTQAGIDLAKSL